jgi:hypothetical protein
VGHEQCVQSQGAAVQVKTSAMENSARSAVGAGHHKCMCVLCSTRAHPSLDNAGCTRTVTEKLPCMPSLFSCPPGLLSELH